MEFYQGGIDCVETRLNLLIHPRLFTQSLLVLASEHEVTPILSRTIDLIRINSSAIVPLVMPSGVRSIEEVTAETLSVESGVPEAEGDGAMNKTKPEFVELHMSGGWFLSLRLEVITTEAIQDLRQVFMHFYDLPMLPFRCLSGGAGFINPANIFRMTIRPRLEGVPANAFPAGLLRWEPGLQNRERL
jgi:hypothetical protein